MKSMEENIIQDSVDSPEDKKKQGLEVSPSSESGSLQERLEALHSAIGHDDPITTEHLDDLHGAVQGMKINIGGKEVSLKDAEGLATINTFLGETNTGWGVKEEDLPTFKVEFTSPTQLDYKEKAEHPDVARFGEYSLNPETFGVDFENAKVEANRVKVVSTTEELKIEYNLIEAVEEIADEIRYNELNRQEN